MNIQLFAFDVDGTLLNSNRELPLSTLDSLRKLKEIGYKIVIASGRSPKTVRPDGLDNDLVDYYVCNNGAFIMDNKGNRIHKDEIDNQSLEKLINICIKNDNPIQICFEDAVHVYNRFDYVEEMIMNWVGKKGLVVDSSLTRNHHLTTQAYAGIVDLVDDINFFRNSVPELGFDMIKDNKYDFFNKGTSKASGIKQICDLLNLDLENVMSFGDNFNDLEMIKQCKIGVAMGNGINEIKEYANYITTSSDNNGIFNALKFYKFI